MQDAFSAYVEYFLVDLGLNPADIVIWSDSAGSGLALLAMQRLAGTEVGRSVLPGAMVLISPFCNHEPCGRASRDFSPTTTTSGEGPAQKQSWDRSWGSTLFPGETQVNARRNEQRFADIFLKDALLSCARVAVSENRVVDRKQREREKAALLAQARAVNEGAKGAGQDDLQAGEQAEDAAQRFNPANLSLRGLEKVPVLITVGAREFMCDEGIDLFRKLRYLRGQGEPPRYSREWSLPDTRGNDLGEAVEDRADGEQHGGTHDDLPNDSEAEALMPRNRWMDSEPFDQHATGDRRAPTPAEPPADATGERPRDLLDPLDLQIQSPSGGGGPPEQSTESTAPVDLEVYDMAHAGVPFLAATSLPLSQAGMLRAMGWLERLP